ncbi:glycosyl transferase family 2 [Pedobacter sp. BS3]|uniref:glycosyl hydrolase n=1 Tax=Pedobacter sp. BS3 TaxID=2567937 RepID=UPI0011EE9E2B|nr:glycosyl hydrolase [Pedobacter sp. BS3]TZF82815.1 glycosyl transferase family 2 [Pedobacter sp. BS3]
MDRRKFIQISSVTAANLALLSAAGHAALFNPADEPVSAISQDELLKHFISPPDTSKSSCYWWWFNGLVDKEGITRDMEEFRAKGMGGVLLVNSSGGLGGVPFPQGAKFLSDEWKELYRHAMKEAKRLNIEVGINLSSGWCMGGPWIKPENSGRWYLQSELTVKGPQKFSGKLPLPGSHDGYNHVFNPPGYKSYLDLPLAELDYHDTAVVAILTPDKPRNRINGERQYVLAAKANRKDASNFARATDIMGPTLFPWKNTPGDKPVPLSNVIDLTSRMSKDGHLNWQVPPGNWTIIRTGHRMTGSRLMIAQPEADGLSVDWFDHKGVDLQFDNLGKLLLDEAAKAGAKPAYFCDDSFEDGFPNWTAGILEKFRKYRGYDAKPYLPVLSGYIIGSAEISDRFLNDYRKTLADCMADEHYKHFADLCHRHGIQVQNEAAGPSRSGTMCMDGLKNLGRSDFPMGEFWLGTKHDDPSTLTPDQPYGVSRLDAGQNKVTKMVASAAHIYGRQTASAEAFTTYRHWLDYPGSLKQALDRAYCEGINRIVIHTSTATRPKDGKPGYEYGAGTHFNPNVTWWEKSGAFFTYVARCQYLLRAGKFVADVLYYNGDTAPNLVTQKHADPALGKGYDYDVCNEEVLLTRLNVKNGRISLPDGMSYRVLVLPDTERMPLAVVRKIGQLAKSGATVIGPAPKTDSGLKNYPQCDKEIKTLATEIWGDVADKKVTRRSYGKGRIVNGESIRNVLLSDGISPDFEYTGEDIWIDYIHRTTDEAEIYFLTNRNKQYVKTECLFRVKDRKPELWDAVSGQVAHPEFRVAGGKTSILLEFHEFQSLFIVFPKVAAAQTGKAWLWQDTSKLAARQQIDGSWNVKFDPAWGGPEAITFNTLQDWSKHPDKRVKYYSGKAVYHNTFDLNRKKTQDESLLLDLGVVKDICQVWLNGKDLGIVWTAPWRVDISDVVKEKGNQLKIEVINLWPNRLIGDAALPKEKRLTNTNIVFKKEDKLLPSGLLGPVTIQGLESVKK